MKVIHLENSPADMTLDEFEQKHGLEMVVHERTPPEAKRYGRYYARLQDEQGYGINTCDDPKSRTFFHGFTCDGATPDEAIEAFLRRISGQYIVPDMADASKDFWCGQITHTRPAPPITL